MSLGAASHMANRSILEYLLSRGVELDIFAGIVLGMSERVRAFLGVDPSLAHARGAHGIPILFSPVIVGERELAELLLAKGAEVNAGAGGNTPLHGAAWFNQPEMAAWLIDRGADLHAQDYEGKTSLAVAVEQGKHEVAEVLRRHGAD